MAVTPRKIVHWDINDISLSELGSPFFNGSMESIVSTSSLEYINSQLVAHGFTPSPGLGLEGISNSDMERVVKCLLGMLSQRMEDMSRTEELTTKLRTLSYDHERLMSMHRAATERAANAEREMNVHKSRLTAAARTLQATEAAHRQTTTELQRTRVILQGIRTTYQNEIRKKEKDVERISEKWSKLADVQSKIMMIPSGMRCVNVGVVDGSEFIGKGQGFLDVALEEAEKVRVHLMDENENLRQLVLTATNELQSLFYQTAKGNQEEPMPFTPATLFPLHPKSNANDKLIPMLTNMRECLAALCQPTPTPATSQAISVAPNGEIERLQGIIADLKNNIEQSQKQSVTQATETQAMFDKFIEDYRVLASDDVREISVELMTIPLRDAEKERMDGIKKDLDIERQKFTEAAIKLGKERAELEAERLKLLDEKRSWQVEMMLAELPPTPKPSEPTSQVFTTRPSPKKSSRKSPAKVCVGKAGTSTRKTIRVSRRSLASPTKVIPSYETEVLPPISALNIKPTPLTSSLLPTAFVLPPPSPQASLLPELALPLCISDSERQDPQIQSSSTPVSLPPSASAEPSTPLISQRVFPVAKPLAQRMIHAYSPAKPSPLSRILMLANSPNSPDGANHESNKSSLLDPIVEGNEDSLGFEEVPVLPQAPIPLPQQTLQAVELDVGPPRESPLQEKKLEQNVPKRPSGTTAGVKHTKGKIQIPDQKRFSAKEKGKKKDVSGTLTIQALTKTSSVEKENDRMKLGTTKVFSTGPKVTQPNLTTGETKNITKLPPKPIVGASTSRARLTVKPPPPNKTGPRRVPVDSVEAPLIGKGWKG